MRVVMQTLNGRIAVTQNDEAKQTECDLYKTLLEHLSSQGQRSEK